MTRYLLLSLATLLAAPALAGDDPGDKAARDLRETGDEAAETLDDLDEDARTVGEKAEDDLREVGNEARETFGRDDLQNDEPNTRQEPRDRRVERGDLHDDQHDDTEKARLDQTAREQDVRFENGRYILTEDTGEGRVEVMHREDAVHAAANEDESDFGQDLRRTAREIVNDAGRGLDRLEDTVDEAIDVRPEDRLEDIEDAQQDREIWRDED